MDSPTNDMGAKPKKKYELSLKKLKNDVKSDRNYSTKKDVLTTIKTYNETAESEDTQDFRLRLSDSFAIDDTFEQIKAKPTKVGDIRKPEVILISDSSDDGSPDKFDWMNCKSSAPLKGGIRKSTSAPNCVYIVKSSDSEDNEVYGQGPSKAGSIDVPVDELQRKCSIAYTSDDDISEDESFVSDNRKRNVFFRSRENGKKTESAKNFEEVQKRWIPSSEEFSRHFSNDNSAKSASGIDNNKSGNVFYRSNSMENKSRITPTASRNVQDFGRKLGLSTEKIKGNFNGESRLGIDSGISSHRKEDIFTRDNNKEMRADITPTSARYGQDSGKKLISSTEKFRETFNNGSRLESESGMSANRKGDVFNRVNGKENNSRITPTTTKNSQDSGKKLISSTERFRGNFNHENGSQSDSGINKSHFTPTSTRNLQDSEKKLISSSERLRGILTDNRCNIETPGKTKILTGIIRDQEPKKTPVLGKILGRTPQSDINKPFESGRTPISAKIQSFTTVLTKKDTKEILKAIRAKKMVYESPKVWKKPRVSDASDVEDSEVENSSPEPAIIKPVKENIEAKTPIVIAETDSDSDSDEKVIQGSRVDNSKPYKTHVTRFLEPSVSDESRDVMSEKKKLEVAKWLLTNSVDSTSDSSVSNISGTQGNSPNSGNSSLERLEQNYETPNNRGKLKKINSVEKPMIAPNTTTSAKSVRQTTIDNFVMKSKDGTHNVLTPINTSVSKKRDLINPLVKEATEQLGIMDCADILDNLYGNAWRDKAKDLLPSTEPRKGNVARKNKGVQTERKVNPRAKKTGKKTSESTSPDEEFDAFVKNIRPNLNSTKKPSISTGARRRDSPSSDDSGGDTTYLTALTNPRISDHRKITNRPTPASLAIQKARAICDSDTEDENDYDYKKQLSFSDDESSSTSEYDPTDVIPQKTKTVGTIKPPRNVQSVPKTSKTTVPEARTKKSKTFLESLCATVPINEAHPDAIKYRQNFKTTKDELGKHLYKLYNEKVFDNKLPKDMSVEWNVRMRGTAGYCYNKRSVRALGGVTRSSRIVLATKILDTPDRLRDTLVHEMCHAAAWLINEVSDGHGPFWKGWAAKAMKAFPELPPIRRCHDYKIATKFTYRCTGCGYSIGRHSKSLDVEKKRCGHCYGKFEVFINKVTKSGQVEMKTPTTKQPSAFALFVKENYQTVKKDRKGVPHKEVMQILGQQFSAIKISKKANNSDENNSDSKS